ncbi:hypothetical protein Tco_0101222, partial [Tanacetum coccineum]
MEIASAQRNSGDLEKISIVRAASTRADEWLSCSFHTRMQNIDDLCHTSSEVHWKRISDKMTKKSSKNRARNGKAWKRQSQIEAKDQKVQSKSKSQLRQKSKSKTEAVIKEDLNGPTLTHLMGRGSPLR